MATEYMTGATRLQQEDAELAAAEKAYAEAHGLDLPQEDTQAPQAEAPAQAPAQEPAEAPQEHEVDWQKRYKDAQSHFTKQTNELKEKLKAAGVEPEETDKVAELEQQLAILQAKDADRETIDLVAQAQAAVSAVHPDFVQVIDSPDFAAWIKEQPEVYQKAIYDDRPDAAMASNALTLFKVQSGFNERQAQMNQQQLQDQAAMSVSGGHREAPQSQQEKVWTWNEIQSLSPYEYDKLESTIDKAIQEGRVH